MTDMKARILEINKITGDNLFYLRTQKGITRKQLADRLYVSQQQVEKYEKGKNRISVGLLVAISDVMGTPIERLINKDRIIDQSEAYREEIDSTTLVPNESLMRLCKYHNAIKDIRLKKMVLDITRVLSKI